MSAWEPDDLRRIGRADELRISSRRADGSLRPDVTIWHAVIGDDLYVRSARGPRNGWFRRAVEAGTGRVRAGGVEREVTFEAADPGIHPALTAALHTKYDRYGPGPVGAITGSDVASTTLRVIPQA